MRALPVVSLLAVCLPLAACLPVPGAEDGREEPLDTGDADTASTGEDTSDDDTSGTVDTAGGDDTPAGDSSTDDTGADTSDGDSGPVDTSDGAVNTDNPLTGAVLWVRPDTRPAQQAEDWRASDPEGAALMDKIASQPVATWLGGWNNDVAGDVDALLDEAAGELPVFVSYNIPARDCGSFSAGGASDYASYTAWIDEVAAGLGGRPAVVVLEPDSVALVSCLDAAELQDRYDMLAYAIDALHAGGAVVYLDAGHSAWVAVSEIADRLAAAGVAEADGFALNVSNYRTTAESVAYGDELSAALGGVRYVVDTSRNGLGPDPGGEWCNPDGRALGLPPTVAPDAPLADALLWVKAPGESDGSCNGGPSAGTWWPEYARGLAERASW